MGLRRALSACVLGLGTGLSAAQAPQPSPAAPSPVITLLDGGPEPRTPLRFEIESGVTQDVVMSTTMTSGMMVDGQPMPSVTSPTMRIVMRMTAESMTSPHAFKTQYEVTRADIPNATPAQEPAAAQLRPVLLSMVGLKGSALHTGRGVPSESQLKPPPGVDPSVRAFLDSMRTQLSQMSTMLPEEPIGVGGRWSVETRLDALGLPLKQTATYTLVRREGTIVDVKIEMKQEALADTVPMPGGDAKIEKWNSSGVGEVRFDLSAPAPMRSMVKTSAASVFSTVIQGRRQAISQSQQVELEIVSERVD